MAHQRCHHSRHLVRASALALALAAAGLLVAPRALAAQPGSAASPQLACGTPTTHAGAPGVVNPHRQVMRPHAHPHAPAAAAPAGPRPRGAARIANRSGVGFRVTLERTGGAGRPGPARLVALGRLRPGDVVDSARLRPGRYRMTAVPLGGARGHAPVVRHLAVHPGETTRVALSRYVAGVTIHNPAHRRVELRVDGRSHGRVGAHAAVAVDGLLPGRHTLTLLGVRSGRVLATTTLDLQPGAAARWRPQLTAPVFRPSPMHVARPLQVTMAPLAQPTPARRRAVLRAYPDVVRPGRVGPQRPAGF